MPESGSAHTATPPQQAVSVRAQILATEHWSLLATRSMTWSEVMSRIVIHLTLLSASLVVLALVAQTAGFGLVFRVFAIGLAATMCGLSFLWVAVVVARRRFEGRAYQSRFPTPEG